MNKLLKVKCPQCDTIFPYYESEFRPFCCERCKMIDLGHWFEESYKVPDKETISTSKNTDEKSTNEEIENENSYDDYTNIDEDTYDENDY
ncbi:MAG: DNA gyrase inhibitor YacG [Alphaproteobacteria bacterium]|nr:MAG: DNA gyrase inhibitor YacG [Alphaproteobacteria bacterium]